MGKAALGARVEREAEPDAGTGRDQRHVFAGFADRGEVGVRHRIDHSHRRAVGFQGIEALANRCRPFGHRIEFHLAHLARRLRLQHPHQIRVGHRRERMVLHARLGEQQVAHVEIAAENRAAVFGECGAGDGEVGLHRIHQRVGHRADVALGGGIKGRAVLKVDLLRAVGLEPLECGERLRHRVSRGDGARFERDDDGIDLGIQPSRRHADHLHRAHAALDQHVGEVGRAGEVVGDATDQHAASKAVGTSASAAGDACKSAPTNGFKRIPWFISCPPAA